LPQRCSKKLHSLITSCQIQIRGANMIHQDLRWLMQWFGSSSLSWLLFHVSIAFLLLRHAIEAYSQELELDETGCVGLWLPEQGARCRLSLLLPDFRKQHVADPGSTPRSESFCALQRVFYFHSHMVRAMIPDESVCWSFAGLCYTHLIYVNIMSYYYCFLCRAITVLVFSYVKTRHNLNGVV
jgi:hypothetical protein